MHMLSPAVSDDCRMLAENLGTLLSRGRHALFAPLVKRFGRNRVDRLVQRTTTRVAEESEAKKNRKLKHQARRWPHSFASFLANAFARECAFSAPEVLDHLLDPTIECNPLIIEFVRGSLDVVNANNIPALNAKWEGLIAGAKKVVACFDTWPMHLAVEELVAAQIQAQQEDFGFDDALALAKRNGAEERRQVFLKRYDPAKTDENVCAILEWGYDDFRSCKGVYRHAINDDVHESIDDFAFEAVKLRNISFRLVSRRLLTPADAKWARTFTRVAAMDDELLIKVCQCGQWLTFRRTGDGHRDAYFNRELARLYRVVDCAEHGRDPSSVLQLLGSTVEDLERRRDQIREEQLENHAETEEFDRPVHRVHFNGRADHR